MAHRLMLLGNQTIVTDKSGELARPISRARSFVLFKGSEVFQGVLTYHADTGLRTLQQTVPPGEPVRSIDAKTLSHRDENKALSREENSVNIADKAARIILDAYEVRTWGSIAQNYEIAHQVEVANQSL